MPHGRNWRWFDSRRWPLLHVISLSIPVCWLPLHCPKKWYSSHRPSADTFVLYIWLLIKVFRGKAKGIKMHSVSSVLLMDKNEMEMKCYLHWITCRSSTHHSLNPWGLWAEHCKKIPTTTGDFILYSVLMESSMFIWYVQSAKLKCPLKGIHEHSCNFLSKNYAAIFASKVFFVFVTPPDYI